MTRLLLFEAIGDRPGQHVQQQPLRSRALGPEQGVRVVLLRDEEDHRAVGHHGGAHEVQPEQRRHQPRRQGVARGCQRLHEHRRDDQQGEDHQQRARRASGGDEQGADRRAERPHTDGTARHEATELDLQQERQHQPHAELDGAEQAEPAGPAHGGQAHQRHQAVAPRNQPGPRLPERQVDQAPEERRREDQQGDRQEQLLLHVHLPAGRRRSAQRRTPPSRRHPGRTRSGSPTGRLRVFIGCPRFHPAIRDRRHLNLPVFAASSSVEVWPSRASAQWCTPDRDGKDHDPGPDDRARPHSAVVSAAPRPPDPSSPRSRERPWLPVHRAWWPPRQGGETTMTLTAGSPLVREPPARLMSPPAQPEAGPAPGLVPGPHRTRTPAAVGRAGLVAVGE